MDYFSSMHFINRCFWLLIAYLCIGIPCPVHAAYPGFDFVFSEGTFWEFYWTYEKTSYVQGSGSSSDTDSGHFRLILGPPKTISNVVAYKVVVEGDTSDPDYNYAPRWQYIAVDDYRILGSVDGTALEVIFDGKAGQWTGGGFFTAFPDERTMVAYHGDIGNEFTSTKAYVVDRTANQDYCETFGGITVCPNDDSYRIDEKEYYKGGIGPLGYYLYTHYASSGGGFSTSFTRTRHVGLTASSLSAIDGFVPLKPPWTSVAGLLTPSSGHSAHAVNGKIYVIGGHTSSARFVQIYDPLTDSWSSGTAPAGSLTSLQSNTGGVFDGKIYVFGGAAVLEYDPQADQWATKTSISTRVKDDGISAVSDGVFIYVFLNNSSRVDAYFPIWDYWFTDSLSVPNVHYWQTACTAANMNIYVFGGYELGPYLSVYTQNTCLQYDPNDVSGTPWAYGASMPTARYSVECASLGNFIFVVGGKQGSKMLRTVEAYDTESNTWTVKKSINVQRTGHQVVALEGKLYVIGGYDGDKKLSSVEVFLPEDSDNDGLPDLLEKDTGCPEISDGDSDNDGLFDGAEDADHDGELDPGETDPCDSDTDGDGIQDGTEIGYTIKEIGIDTDSLAFQPDLDPATTTDPLKKDTDGDGLSDGQEDVNYNGRLDEGETDPQKRNVRAMPWLPILLE